MSDHLKVLLNQKERIVRQAEKIVLRKIQRYCKRYKRTVKTVYGITVLKGSINHTEAYMEDEIYDSQPEKWIIDFEDKFGPFPLVVCHNGKWIEGQTPLIKFFKPKL